MYEGGFVPGSTHLLQTYIPLGGPILTKQTEPPSLEIVGHLGSGKTAQVLRGRLNGQPCAVKIPFSRSYDIHELWELQRINKAPDKTIAKLIGYAETPYASGLITEIIYGCTLSDWNKVRPVRHPSYNEHQIQQMMFLPLSALGFMHENGFVFPDFKPDNVMCRNTLFGFQRGALIDIDSCVTTDKSLQWDTTPAYRHPDECDQQPRPEHDIYNVGVCFHELLTKKLPARENIINENFPHLKKYAPKLAQLIVRMLSNDSALRPHIDEVVATIRPKWYETATRIF